MNATIDTPAEIRHPYIGSHLLVDWRGEVFASSNIHDCKRLASTYAGFGDIVRVVENVWRVPTNVQPYRRGGFNIYLQTAGKSIF